jgi:hypothetical protein
MFMQDLFAALAKAQGQIEAAVKDSKNPFFKSSYADLQSVWNAIKEPLTSNGLCVIQTVEFGEAGEPRLVTTLGHASGQMVRGHYPLNPKDDSPQSWGSAISYARRYALSAMVGVYQKDDDGEGAHGRNHDDHDDKKPKDIPKTEPKPKQDPPKQQVNTQIHRIYSKVKEAKWSESEMNAFILLAYKKNKVMELNQVDTEHFINLLSQRPSYEQACQEYRRGLK